MTGPRDNVITMTEIQRITRHCLNLLTCTSRLRHNEETAEAHAQAQDLFASIRKLLIGSLMYRRTLICVSGLQGAGKTTLMKNFYGLGDRYLCSTLSRGERLPILITEKQGVSSPSAWAVRIDEDKNGDYVQQEVRLTEAEFATAVTGTDEQIMYLELKVPFRHTRREGLSFVLLPGFEPKSEYWNNLIEFSVNSSDAAVFVFNETSFSNENNEDCLKWIEKRFGENLVYAITGSDSSPDGNASVKETCLHVLNISAPQADRVVCVGEYPDQARNEAWIKDFKNALERYAYTDMQLVSNSQYLCREVKNISDSLYQIQSTLKQASDSMQIVDNHNDSLLKAFDKMVETQRANIERELDEQFKVAKKQSADNLYEQFSSTPKVSMLKRLFLGNDLKQVKKTEELVMQSLQDSGRGRDCSLPAKHLGLALRASLTSLDQPEDRTNLRRLTSGDMEKVGEQQLQLMCGENLKAVANDVCVLLAEPGKGEPATLQCKKDKYLMRSMAELATYYFSMESYDQMAVGTGLGAYEPAKIDMLPKNMLSGAESSKKFIAGMVGMMGVDLLEDGVLNIGTKIAASLGIITPVGKVLTVAAVVGGAVTAATQDLTRMQREDYNSAVLAVWEVYDQIKLNALEKYDHYMERIRERMEDNLGAAHPGGGQLIDVYNAQREIAMALELLRSIEQRIQEDAYSPLRRG